MRTDIFCTAATLLAGSANALNLKSEHAGGVFSRVHGSSADGVLHNGTASGRTVALGNETGYVTFPPGGRAKAAVLYMTDIFGLDLINNKLLADSIAKAGYLVVVPDLFRGEPVPADALEDPASNFSLPEWQQRHPQAEIESILDTTINSIRTTYNASNIGSVGYCFGGRYVARYLAEGKGIDAGFAAHPSNTQAEEWEAIASPISIAFGDLDQSSTPENRTNIEEIFFDGNKTYQTSLYSNAEHGFAVRTNLTDKQKAFAQEGAYFQAIRWLDAWATGQD
ncbi:hypothetical protein Q7P37_001482 [Cladosporium fusiforme]